MRRVLSVRSLKTTALLAAVAVLAVPAAADAQTHRFRATTDVTVSFELPRAAASGTLVRFARNGLALTRSGGTLTLQASGRHAKRLALPARGAARVLVDVSAADGIARLSVARRTASMAGRFVAEDAVTVRNRRAVRALRIRTAAPSACGGSHRRNGAAHRSIGDERLGCRPRAAPAGAAPAPPAPPAVPPTPLFAPDSVWNAPLAAAAPLDPAGPQLVQKLRDTVAQNLAARTGPWIATNQSGTPVYRVAATQPLVRVQLHTGWWGDTLQTAFESVPIPADARPGQGQTRTWSSGSRRPTATGSSSTCASSPTAGMPTTAERSRTCPRARATSRPPPGPGSRSPTGAPRRLASRWPAASCASTS